MSFKPFLARTSTIDRTREVEKQIDKSGKKKKGQKQKTTEQNLFILLSGFSLIRKYFYR
ncbi:MAG: hypothetical protein ACJA2D_000374 [Pseudohongiellaceae bacterium]|jgi:hypothetical protein